MMKLKLVEIVVITVLILFQLYIAFKLFLEIKRFNNIFKNPPKVDSKFTTINNLNDGDLESILFENDYEETEELVEVSYLSTSTKNEVMNNIVVPINTYLIKNKGIAIDFHILKDIVDRNVEIVEDNIAERVPAPLYIGLAATMLGIIFGLFSVSFDVPSNGSGELALQAIKPLIDGVKLAMSASVVGLILTTIFSVWIFKDAKSKVESGKNQFLSLLQSELMPKMNRSKLPEVDVLARKIDAFSKSSISIVSHLGTIVNDSKSSIEREQQLLQDIRALDVRKVSAVNLDIFNKLDGMMGSFQSFAKYYEQLDSSLLNTTKLVDNLDKFVRNTDNINVILQDLKSIINKSDQASDFFSQHIKSFSQYGDAVNESVADSDSRMSKAIDVLGVSVEKQFEAFNESIAEYDSKLSIAFDNSIKRFNESAKDQIDKTELAFNNSRPKFEKLEHLEKLSGIENKLSQLESGLIDVIKITNREIVDAISSGSYAGSSSSISSAPKSKKKRIFENISSGIRVASYVVIVVAGIVFIYKTFF